MHALKIGGSSSAAYAMATAARRQETAAPSTISAPSDKGAEASRIRAYDFTRMTPGEMGDAASRFYESGEIDLTQLFMLQNAGVPLGKVGANGEFVPLTAAERESFRNTPVDFIQTAKDALAGIESQGRAAEPTSGYQGWKDILALLQSRQGQISGVDLRA
jgi:hypothetical protein